MTKTIDVAAEANLEAEVAEGVWRHEDLVFEEGRDLRFNGWPCMEWEVRRVQEDGARVFLRKILAGRRAKKASVLVRFSETYAPADDDYYG